MKYDLFIDDPKLLGMPISFAFDEHEMLTACRAAYNLFSSRGERIDLLKVHVRKWPEKEGFVVEDFQMAFKARVTLDALARG